MSVDIVSPYLSRSKRRLLGLSLFLVVCACGADGDGARNNGVPAADGPLYAINTRVFSRDFSNQVSFLLLVDDLKSGEANLSEAIELPGAGSLWGWPEAGELFFVSAENLSVSKYTLTESGRLEPRDEAIGLLNSGVANLITEAIALSGPDRGFFFDMGSEQAIELDLDNMEIRGTSTISGLRLESAALTYLGDGGFKKRGDEFVGVVYGSNAIFDEVDANSKVGFFDPSDGSLDVINAPCGGLQYSFQADNGDWYFSTDPWVGGIHALDSTRAPVPCLVRLGAGRRQFDGATIALNDLTGGVTGGIIPGRNASAFVRVLDETAFPLQPDTGFLEPFSARAWTTWRIDLTEPTRATRVERGLVAGGIKFAEVDGEVYQNASEADFSSTTLVYSTEEGELVEGLVVPGVSWNIVRVR